MAWKITFTSLGDLPGMLLFLLPTCVMGATPMLNDEGSAQTHQRLHCSHTWRMDVDEDSDKKNRPLALLDISALALHRLRSHC